MTALLTNNLPLLAGAPNGIKKLRELILELAVRGKLVPQDPSDEPASELLKQIAEEKSRLVDEGKLKRQKSLDEINDDEMPFELPLGWSWVRLGQITEASTGNAFKSSEYRPSGTLVLRVTNINPDGTLDLSDAKYIDPIEADSTYKSVRLEQDDILLVMVGGSLGKIGIVDKSCLPAVLNQNMWKIFRPRTVCRDYLVYGLRLINSTQLKITSSTHGHLAQGEYLSKLFPLAPEQEQHRIVTKVDELMALCDRLEAQQADAESAHAQLVQALLDSLTQASDATDFAANWQRLAEHFHTLFTTEPSIDALKQTLLQLAVMGKLVLQDPSDEPASELLKRITEEKARLVAEGKIKKQKALSEIGEEERAFELPQGWQWARKAEVFSFLNGYAFKSEWFRLEGIRLLRNVNVSHGVINWKETACISEEQAVEFQGFSLAENDVVLTLDRPIISTGLKYAVIRSTDLPCLLLQRVAKIAPYAGAVTVSYLSAWLNSRFFVDSIDPGRSNGVPHISTNQVANMLFALPPLPEQHRIVAKVDQLMALCDQLKTRLTQARQLNEQLASTLVEQAVA